MKTFLPPVALALAAAVAACGSPNVDPLAAAAAAPTYDHASMQMDTSDAAAPLAAPPQGSAALTQAAASDPCHPLLFVRTHDLVSRWNRHIWRHLRHEQELIARSPKLTAGATVTWEDVKDGIDRRFSMTESADGASYTFELDLAVAPVTSSTTFTKVFWGSIAHGAPSATVSTTDASLTFDFSALHSVMAGELATGQLSAQVSVVKDTSKPAPGVRKLLTATLKDFLPEEGDPAGPRSGTETHLSEPGVGGSLFFQDSLVLGCPANPSSKLADLTTFSRWFRAADGGLHGRADTKATGGQIAAGDEWYGASCYTGVGGAASNAQGEGGAFWLMKLEDSTGQTVAGSSHSAQVGAAPCDPFFGAVPTLTDSSNDLDLNHPPSPAFLGQW